MAHGQIASDKDRVLVIVPKELKDWLRERAAVDNRSMSNYIVKILMEQKDKDQTF